MTVISSDKAGNWSGECLERKMTLEGRWKIPEEVCVNGSTLPVQFTLQTKTIALQSIELNDVLL